MKKLITVLLVLAPFIGVGQFSLFGVWSAENEWIHPKEYLQTDKVAHAGVGFAVGSVVTATAYSLYKENKKRNAAITGVMAAFTVGLVKEVIDDHQPNNRFSETDFWATFWGGVGGSCLISYTYSLGGKNGPLPEVKPRRYSFFGKKEIRTLAMQY